MLNSKLLKMINFVYVLCGWPLCRSNVNDNKQNLFNLLKKFDNQTSYAIGRRFEALIHHSEIKKMQV